MLVADAVAIATDIRGRIIETTDAVSRLALIAALRAARSSSAQQVAWRVKQVTPDLERAPTTH